MHHQKGKQLFWGNQSGISLQGHLLHCESHSWVLFFRATIFSRYTLFLKMWSFLFFCRALKHQRGRKWFSMLLNGSDLTDKIKSKPAQLSGGESQRVAIARAMVKRPAIVLADEPTANLDAANSHNILQTMEKLNRELHTTFIFATHDEKVIGYVRRKIFLFDGKVAKDEKIEKTNGEIIRCWHLNLH